MRRVLRRWPVVFLGVAALGLAVALAGVLLRDWRVRLRTLVQLDPPPRPVEVRLAGHRLSVTGARVTELDGDRLGLRAWSPGPSLRVTEAGGADPIVVTVENLPRRARARRSTRARRAGSGSRPAPPGASRSSDPTRS